MMRFICDAMLGKLARWLRIMGYDTTLAGRERDRDLLEIAKKENRILITRDKSLPGIHVPEDLVGQIMTLVKEVNLYIPTEPQAEFCPVCNGHLIPTENGLPPGVKNGWKCEKCGKLYWEGSHWKRMRSFLKKLRDLESSQVNDLDI